jgi:Xaa-Pro aminopeptidase
MRIKEFQKTLFNNKIDCVFLFSADADQASPAFSYFTNYVGYGALIIPKQKKPFLIVPAMEYEKAKKHSSYQVLKLKKKKKLTETLVKIIKRKKLRLKTIGIDYTRTTLSQKKGIKKYFKKKRWKDIYKLFRELRTIKTKNEIKVIKKSCNITSAIFKKCFRKFKTFKKESDVKSFLIFETLKAGCTPAFHPIVASGKGASQPHYNDDNKISKGFCVIDYGVKYKGYCSDITRTVYIGKPKKSEINAYNNLLSIQEETIKKLKEGIKTKDIDTFVRNKLGKQKKYFIHSLGHGIGVEIHELPNLSPLSKDIIKQGMIFTIEPGIYLPKKFGIRIEDDILMTNKGPIVLTKVNKKLIRI